jgi:carbon-monoxide dehydrogenase large subunit
VAFDNVDIVFGDTDRVQFGMGTYGSRSLVVGGAALAKASDKVVTKGKKIAAHLLEASEQDIQFEAGVFSVAGTDRGKTFQEIAGAAYVPHNYPLEVLEPGLEEQAYYDPINFTYPGGCHIAEVEIDPETGIVTLEKYTAVDDVGTVINPMIVEGQLHGGIVQGVGQALYESAVYDDVSGQLLSGSFMDYCMPRADHLPNMTIKTHSTLCTHTPRGAARSGPSDRRRLSSTPWSMRCRTLASNTSICRRRRTGFGASFRMPSCRARPNRRNCDEVFCLSPAEYSPGNVRIAERRFR